MTREGSNARRQGTRIASTSAPNGAPAMSSRATELNAPRPDPREESVVSSLRRATRATHERLEAALPLTDPGLIVDAYRVIVEAFYGFYAPLEAGLAMATATGDPPIQNERAKVGRLRGVRLPLRRGGGHARRPGHRPRAS